MISHMNLEPRSSASSTWRMLILQINAKAKHEITACQQYLIVSSTIVVKSWWMLILLTS